MVSRKKWFEAEMEALRRLFAASTPSLDLDEYIATTCKYCKRGGSEEIITLDSHLTEEERINRGLVYYIPFNDHKIKESLSGTIIGEVASEFKMNKTDATTLKQRLYLGAAPAFYKD